MTRHKNGLTLELMIFSAAEIISADCEPTFVAKPGSFEPRRSPSNGRRSGEQRKGSQRLPGRSPARKRRPASGSGRDARRDQRNSRPTSCLRRQSCSSQIDQQPLSALKLLLAK